MLVISLFLVRLDNTKLRNITAENFIPDNKKVSVVVCYEKLTATCVPIVICNFFIILVVH